jgi:hypothetical protein
MAVLGLLVRQSDTVAGVRLRLDEEHPNACWSRNIVHNSLTSHLKTGFVRAVRSRPERLVDVYEVTSEGVEHFRRSLRESSAALPAQRDALRARLKYVEGEDEFWAAIRDIRKREELCMREGAAAVTRYKAARRLGRLTPSDEQDWKTRVDRALMIDDVKSWYEIVKGLQRLRQYLEDPRGVGDMLDVRAGDG